MPNYTQIQLRRDTTANWTAANPILAEGEFTYDITANKIKIGDGITNWNNLPYTSLSAYEIALNNGFVGTEQEWLDSLKGKSAYDLAVEYGYTNSEEQWVASLIWTDSFITVWNTENLSSGSSATQQIRLPFVSTGTYNCLVDWGDGSADVITTWDDPKTTHTYSESGIYTIRIVGVCKGFVFNNTGDRLKIVNILQWGGDLRTIDLDGCSNLIVGANDIFNTAEMTDFTNIFYNCNQLSQVPNMNIWNVSNVTNMLNMFYGCTNFNQPLNNWNVSKVTNMTSMFYGCTNFNQPLNSWNVSNVTNMRNIFYDCRNFNQPLDNWNVSNVTIMSNMLSFCINFNQPLDNWDVSNVANMSNMLFGCTSYSIENYDNLLIAWSQLPLRTNVVFGGSPNGYSSAGASARQYIIDTFGWTIVDGGLKP